MRTGERVLLGASLILISAGLALTACVGDDPSDAVENSTDASPSTNDGTTPNDGGGVDTGSSTTDASDAGIPETFDGSNPTCNGLFPQDAPMPATIECDGGAILSPTGGTIYTGTYYLVDQKYPSGLCPSDTTGYSDVIKITDTGDGGLTVNAALNGKINSRLTLAWDLTGGTISQFDICPSDPLNPKNIGYNATFTTLIYFLPGFGNLTYQKF